MRESYGRYLRDNNLEDSKEAYRMYLDKHNPFAFSVMSERQKSYYVDVTYARRHYHNCYSEL